MDGGPSARRFFVVLLVVAVVLFGYLVWPIGSALFLAATLAGVIWPIHRRLAERLRGRRSLSAAVFVLGLILVVLAPAVAFSAFAISEGSKGMALVSRIARSESISDVLARLPPAVGKPAQHLLDRLPVEDEQLTEKLKQQAAAQGGNADADRFLFLPVAGRSAHRLARRAFTAWRGANARALR
jgi:predicted PurR-regulated permease PerM